jgi:hypothetical protein
MKFYLILLLIPSLSYASACETSYEGSLNLEGVAEGQGIAIYENCDKYVGSFVDGERLGKGKYFYNDGDVFEGEFFETHSPDNASYFFNKQGTFFYNSNGENDVIEANGKFLGSVQVGSGDVTFGNGDKFVGFFEDDYPVDYGQYFYKDGRIVSGTFRGEFKNYNLTITESPDGNLDYEFHYPDPEIIFFLLLLIPFGVIAQYLLIFYAWSMIKARSLNIFKRSLTSHLKIYFLSAGPLLFFISYFEMAIPDLIMLVLASIALVIIFRVPIGWIFSGFGWISGVWVKSTSELADETKKVSGLIAGAKCMWCSNEQNLKLIKGEIQEEGLQYLNKDGSPDLRYKKNEMLVSFVSEYLCGDCGAVSEFKSKKSLLGRSFFGKVTPNKSTSIAQGRWIKQGRGECVFNINN